MRMLIITYDIHAGNATMLEPSHNQPLAHHETSTVASPRFAAPHIDSQRLLAGGRELVIQHGAEEYRLRLTRNDKLILTK